MAETVTDNPTGAAIVADLAAAVLAVLAAGGDGPAFAAVGVYQNRAAAVAALTRLDGAAAGVVAPIPNEYPGMDSTERQYLIRGEVVVGYKSTRPPGADDGAAAAEAQRLADAARRAVMADPSRGGRAMLVVAGGGSPVNGTSIEGPAAVVTARAAVAWHAVAFPFACGWRVPRD